MFANYVLFVPAQELDAEALFRECNGDQVALLDSPETPGPGVWLRRQTVNEVPLPPDEALAYFGRGLSPESVARLKMCSLAISLTGLGPFDPQHGLLKSLTRITGKMARQLDAFIHDTADALTFTPEAFQDIRGSEIESGELSPNQFGVRAYRIEGGLRGVTMGLEKFGHSNICLARFAEHHMGAAQSLMGLVMQRFIEADEQITPGLLELDVEHIRNSKIRQDLQDSIRGSGTGRATLTFEVVEPISGDPKDLLGPRFRAAGGKALAAEQEALYEQLFGAARDVSEGVSFAELEEAIHAARATAAKILGDPQAWQTPGRRLRLAVEIPDSQEVVWVEVQSWNGEQGAGILLSEPRSTRGLKSGSTFEFQADMIMDFALTDPERVLAAGGIDELVKRMQSEN